MVKLTGKVYSQVNGDKIQQIVSAVAFSKEATREIEVGAKKEVERTL